MNTVEWSNYTIHFSGKTDLGRKRSNNEDMYLLLPEAFLFCVADGAGGLAAGRKASETTIFSIEKYFKKAVLPIDKDATPPAELVFDSESKKPLLAQAIEYANKKVFANITSDSMASTIVSCHFEETDIGIGHVGDSRAYLIRDATIERLTDDHSYPFELFRLGKISKKEVDTHPQRNVITRAVGPMSDVNVSYKKLSPEDNDLILLCSDGLSSMVDDMSILEICRHDVTLDKKTDHLISAANEAGGKDNITVILLQLRSL